jgi:hypothetical protein
MKLLYHSFLQLLATSTDQALARYLQYLKAENQILRAKLPRRLTVSLEERCRLLKFGKPLGPAIKDLVTIVSPRTFARWVSGETTRQGRVGGKPKRGRPRTEQAIRDLIFKLARACDRAHRRRRYLQNGLHCARQFYTHTRTHSPPNHWLFLDHSGPHTSTPQMHWPLTTRLAA